MEWSKGGQEEMTAGEKRPAVSDIRPPVEEPLAEILRLLAGHAVPAVPGAGQSGQQAKQKYHVHFRFLRSGAPAEGLGREHENGAGNRLSRSDRRVNFP